jgi:hypothetical protein
MVDAPMDRRLSDLTVRDLRNALVVILAIAAVVLFVVLVAVPEIRYGHAVTSYSNCVNHAANVLSCKQP